MGKETKRPVYSIKHTNKMRDPKEKEGEKGISGIFEGKKKSMSTYSLTDQTHSPASHL